MRVNNADVECECGERFKNAVELRAHRGDLSDIEILKPEAQSRYREIFDRSEHRP